MNVSVSPRKSVVGVSDGRVRVLGCRYRIGRLVIQALITDDDDNQSNEREVDRCVDVLSALPLLRVVSTHASASTDGNGCIENMRTGESVSVSSR